MEVAHSYCNGPLLIQAVIAWESSGVARSQTTPGHCTNLFVCFVFFWSGRGGWGVLGAYPSKFLHLRATVATQIVLETILFEMPSVLQNRE